MTSWHCQAWWQFKKSRSLSAFANMPEYPSGAPKVLPCSCAALHVLKVRFCDAMQAEHSQGHREVITANWHASVMPVAVAQAHNTSA